MMFYQKPTVLDRNIHRSARVKMSGGDFSFAKQTNSVPLLALEFPRAALDYPIVFAGPNTASLLPAALLGLHTDENLYVSASGGWTGGYIPAFIRRYPFVLAEKPGGGGEFSVCIDTAYPGWENPSGTPLFDASGAEAPLLKEVLTFLGQYQNNVAPTQTFIKKLVELDLLISREIRSRDGGNKFLSLRGLYVIDEPRLAKLSDAQITDLCRTGFMGLIHAHLLSLGNLVKLERSLLTGSHAAAPATAPEAAVSATN